MPKIVKTVTAFEIVGVKPGFNSRRQNSTAPGAAIDPAEGWVAIPSTRCALATHCGLKSCAPASGNSAAISARSHDTSS